MIPFIGQREHIKILVRYWQKYLSKKLNLNPRTFFWGFKNKFKLALFSQQILDGYIDSTKQTLDLIKKNKIPKYKNKAKDTLALLNYDKYLKLEKRKR